MSRISIDVTAKEHQKIKAMAALQGKSIKEFVLGSTLGAVGVDAALAELEAILDERIERAKSEGPSGATVEEIFERARVTLGPDG